MISQGVRCREFILVRYEATRRALVANPTQTLSYCNHVDLQNFLYVSWWMHLRVVIVTKKL